MSTPSTIPFTAPRSASQPWTPSDRDRLIFQWVKFDGHKQSWVAEQLDIHQSSVSRIVERYERWIARGGPSQQGSPSHDERLRTQRWLTYERNEWILSSALRIAGEMERQLDVSKSTITRPSSEPSKETEVRTQHATLDRSGTAARFLRLAYRINMDQLKLLEQDPLPPLEPLSIEESGDDRLPALADLPSGESAGCHGHPASVVAGSPDPATPGCHGHPARADRANEACPLDDPSNSPSELSEAHERAFQIAQAEAPLTSSSNYGASACIEPAAAVPLMHETHTAIPAQQQLTDCATRGSDENQPAEKIVLHADAVAASPPETTNPPHFPSDVIVVNFQSGPNIDCFDIGRLDVAAGET